LSAEAAVGLMREVRQQCAGHLPLGRQATANGSLSTLRTGTTDPLLPFRLSAPATVMQPFPAFDLRRRYLGTRLSASHQLAIASFEHRDLYAPMM